MAQYNIAEGLINVDSGGNCIIYATDRINSIKIKPPSTSFEITEQSPAEWSFHFILIQLTDICDVFVCAVDFGDQLILVYNYYRIALSHKAMMLERDRF